MCLGIPARVKAIVDADNCVAVVEVSGVERKVNMACVITPDRPLDRLVGAWVLLHVGFAMSVIDEEEAAKTLEVLEQLGDVQAEIVTMRQSALP
jgi:hydrogenase expression/formation protein HypC